MRASILALIVSLLALYAMSAQAEELYLPYQGEEITVETYPNAASPWRFIWLYSQYDQLMNWERPMLPKIQQAGVEVWATDILGSLFMTRTSGSVRRMDGETVATVLQAAHEASEQDGKGIVLLASDRMAGLALKGIRAWQAAHLGETSHFKGSILLFPNLYASTPLAGEAPNWESVVSATQAPVMILQPEQGVHRWYMPLLSDALSQQDAAVYTWILPGVKDYFFNPFGKERTEIEQQITERLPQIFKLSAQRLTAHASEQNPTELAALQQEAEVKSTDRHGLPKLHQFDQPKQAPGLVGSTFDGEMMDLADWRGKVVLVNFWATWCPPCVTEIPSMNRLLAKYREQGLEIFSVDFQQSAEEIAKFTQRVPVDYPIVLDQDGRISKDWGVFSFPTTFVVDRQGKVRYSLNQGVEWDIPELEAPILDLLNEH
mgnify:FL=1